MSRVAIRYAKAILELALEQNTADTVNADMHDILQMFSDSVELKRAIASKAIPTEVKVATLKEVFGSSNSSTLKVFDLLAQNRRLENLEDVAKAFIKQYKHNRGEETAYVTTAVELTDDLKAKILDRVKTLTTAKHIEIENTIDETILGGFILRVGDLQYNASLANQLHRLKREITLN